jgi:hypothetical protein
LARADLSQNLGTLSGSGWTHYSNLLARGAQILTDLPEENDGMTNAFGGSNAVTFVTDQSNPHMEIRLAHGSPTQLFWHWGDGTITRGASIAQHAFDQAGVFTNYVEVTPPECVSYFGSQMGMTHQGITAIYQAKNFPHLNFLYCYQESLTELSLAACSNLVQLHLAANPVSTAVCDQWFLDLDQAVTGPVSGADFYYPASQRSVASDIPWSNLVNKGYVMYPF